MMADDVLESCRKNVVALNYLMELASLVQFTGSYVLGVT